MRMKMRMGGKHESEKSSSERIHFKSKNRTYTIDGYVGAGSNSVVYRAFYYDTFMPDRRHIVLLKELYPFDENEISAGMKTGV